MEKVAFPEIVVRFIIGFLRNEDSPAGIRMGRMFWGGTRHNYLISCHSLNYDGFGTTFRCKGRVMGVGHNY